MRSVSLTRLTPSILPPGTVLAADDPYEKADVRVSDIVIGTRRTSVLIVRDAEGVRAFLNLCPHARYPLDTFDGRVLCDDNGALICSAHGAIFDRATGDCLGGPGLWKPLTPIPITRVDGKVVVSEPAQSHD